MYWPTNYMWEENTTYLESRAKCIRPKSHGSVRFAHIALYTISRTRSRALHVMWSGHLLHVTHQTSGNGTMPTGTM